MTTVCWVHKVEILAAFIDCGDTVTAERYFRRLRLKCDGTRAETKFRLSAKRTSPFKLAGSSVQSTTGSRGVRISSSNAGYTMFRGRVEEYWLPTPFASFPFTYPPVRHRVPSHFNWTQHLKTLLHVIRRKMPGCCSNDLSICTITPAPYSQPTCEPLWRYD